MSGFEGQSAIVTGAATGIGESTARILAEKGAEVTVMDFNAEGAKEVAASINDSGGKAHPAVVDLTDWVATLASVNQVHNRAGSIDVLVHSAGGFPKYVSLLDCPVDTWDGIVDSNLKSMFHLLKAAAPLMVEAKYGRFVTLSSMAARSGVNPNPPHYTAAKGGVLALTRQAALELGPHGITVNAVAPANVNSPRGLANRTQERIAHIQKTTPLRRLSEPHEIAEAVVFLCSREAGYITGVTLDVNGGATMV
ncbi:MAG: SDR family NAD(P)-dependent oxidoreductase [Nitrospinae bacterium]|nr:SDR family NAD(P)-dependent oxidoreductase [Nitrospinota bacterium]